MKKIIFLMYLVFSFMMHYMVADPLIVVVLMVKNEEPVIVDTLRPLVEGGIDTFLIFDTGSTDATQEKAREFLQMHGVKNIHIIQEPFVDFSVSRNRALDLAEELLPTADFMLMPDAEWHLQNTKGLVEFCRKHRHDTDPAYRIRTLHGGSLDYDNCRLIRCKSKARFKCPVHEYLDYHGWAKVPDDVYFSWNSTQYGTEKSSQRWFRDRDILLKGYHENPLDPRTLFYLAQTYECLNDQEKACHFYRERIRIDEACTWPEETYMSYYRLAQMTELLASKEPERYDWSQALHYYLKAYAVRPSRAEPLIKIAEHYKERDNHLLACLFASRAVAIPYPIYDCLFVEKTMYTYTRYDILGRCAWYIGEFDKGEDALRKGLCGHPNDHQLRSNLSFYINRNTAMGKYGVKKIELSQNADTPTGSKIWSILICSIVERKQQLEALLEKLKKQIYECNLENQIEILVFSDNRGDCCIGSKRNALMKASTGTYINFIDDDDDIDNRYITMIYDKLQKGPDCVSLVGIRTQDGGNPHTFIHSLDYTTYFMENGIFYRPPNHLNPIKRELIIPYSFPDINWYEDTTWALEVAKSGCLKTQEVINEPYYFYKYLSKDKD